jgi:hypothetical protein
VQTSRFRSFCRHPEVRGGETAEPRRMTVLSVICGGHPSRPGFAGHLRVTHLFVPAAGFSTRGMIWFPLVDDPRFRGDLSRKSDKSDLRGGMERRLAPHLCSLALSCENAAPCGAPSWRFLASGRAFREPETYSGSPSASSSQAVIHRRSFRRARRRPKTLPPGGDPGPPGDAAANRASGRHIPLRSDDASRERPSVSGNG